MRKVFEVGGFVAGAVLIVFGVVAIVMGVNARSTVGNSLKQEQIVGTSDMTPAGITAEAKAAGLKNVSIPTCSVANKAVTTGADGRFQLRIPRGSSRRYRIAYRAYSGD